MSLLSADCEAVAETGLLKSGSSVSSSLVPLEVHTPHGTCSILLSALVSTLSLPPVSRVYTSFQAFMPYQAPRDGSAKGGQPREYRITCSKRSDKART